MTKVALMSIEGPQSSTPSLTKMAADESCSAGSATGSSVLTVVGPKEIHHEEPFPKGTLVTIQPWVQRFPFNQNPSNVLMARVRDVEKLPDRLVAIYFQTFRPFEGEVVTRVTTHQHLGVLSGGIKRSSDDEIDAQRHKAYESRGRLDEDENRVYSDQLANQSFKSEKVFRPDPGPPGCGLMDCHDGFASEPDLLSIHETTVFVYCTHGKGHFAEISHLELQDIAPGSDAEIMYSNVDPDESKNIEHVENTAYAHLASKRRTKGVVFGFHGLEAAEMAKSGKDHCFAFLHVAGL
ncbi:MAG: hypothetical protein M1823_001726 [Watsoniomyces obsoletus]|nr:MAG: hypothetical protein M1823_001726 [Watsoniomyces obsoletus]